jgi:hypothetical protein
MSKTMKVGVPYIATKASDDNTFRRGDHFTLCKDGAILCREAGGWIPAKHVPDAISGMTFKLDQQSIKQRKAEIERELAALEAMK